jgi:predicted NBD/HSP70 family sugar kinase
VTVRELGGSGDIALGRNAPHVRQHNRRLVLHVLRTSGPMSRRRVAELTGLQPATLTNLVADLIDQGLLHEIGQLPSRSAAGGRPQVLVDLRPRGACVGGIYVGIRRVYVSVGDVTGQVLAREDIPRRDTGDVLAALERVCEAANVLARQLTAIGLVVVVDPHHDAAFDERLAQELQARFERPVVSDRAAAAMMLSESLFGAVRGERCVLVHLGTTVAAGVQWGHTVLGRYGYWHAPIGHTVVDPAGQDCECGGRGCLDTVASERALVARAVAALRSGEGSSLTERRLRAGGGESGAIAAAAARGDVLAIRLVEAAAEALGVAVANCLLVLSADRCVIAGPILAAGDVFMRALRARVEPQVERAVGRAPHILPSTFGADAPFMAGVAIALDQFVFGPG